MRTRSVAVLVVSIALLAGVFGLTSAATYDVYVPGSIDIPDQTVSFEGEEFTVSSVAQIDAGQDLTVEVTASGGNYNVRLYRINDGSHDIMDTKGPDEVNDGEVTFTVDLSPDLYVVSINANGSFRDIHPVIVAGYDVTATVPETAEKGTDVSVAAEFNTSQSSLGVSSVEAVLAKGNDAWVYEMSGSDGEYNASIPLADRSTGEYAVYVVIRGTEEINGEHIPIGVSRRHTLEITASSTPTPTPTPTPTSTPTPTPTESGGGGDSGGGDSGGGADPAPVLSPTPTPTPTPTVTPTPSPTPTPTPAPTPTATRTPTPTTSGSTATATPMSTSTPTETADNKPNQRAATPTDRKPTASTAESTSTLTSTSTPTPSPTPSPDAIITPAATPTSTTERTPTPGQPGFTATGVVVALLALLLLRRRSAS